jgi:hypothetical protein
LAFFLTAKRCDGKHYSGQSADKEIYDAFQLLSKGDQEAVASALCRVKIHDSVLKAIKDLEVVMADAQDRPKKRRRKLTIQCYT